MPMEDMWIRDGGRVCLDFVNTLRDRWREPRETLHTPEELARWLGSAGLVARRAPLPARRILDGARLLRDAVDHVVLAAARGDLPEVRHVTLLNDACREVVRDAPQLEISAGRLAAAPRTARAADVSQALGLIAEDAITLALSAEVTRVRVCASDRCGLRFVDRSPARNRQWCSMARCGNRAKVRRHHTRTTG